MGSYDFFPAEANLRQGIMAGAALLLAPLFLWAASDLGDAPVFGKALLVAFALPGLHEIFRGVRGLVSPSASFTATAEGFTVRGKRGWRWDELVEVRVRRVWMGPLPVGTWVSLKVKKNGRGIAKRVEIPKALLPGGAEESAAAILQAAELAGWHPKGKRMPRKAARPRDAFAAR